MADTENQTRKLHQSCYLLLNKMLKNSVIQESDYIKMLNPIGFMLITLLFSKYQRTLDYFYGVLNTLNPQSAIK